jgi:myo-inositol-1(or 4)-monophosphatase
MPPSIPELSLALTTIERIAVEAGSIVLEGWGKRPETASKGVVNDLVTEFDERSEAFIVRALARTFARYDIVAEEGHRIDRDNSEGVLYVDPLDGTTNFAHGLPIFAVCIGLACDGVPLAGVVHAPALAWTFSGARGLSATFNGKGIGVSSVSRVRDALLVTGFSASRPSPDTNIAEFARLTALAQATRRLGSAALDLCCVACGWCDGFWEHQLKPWDVAAGAAIVGAAGGVVTNLDGSPLSLNEGRLLASNGYIHQELGEILASVSRA